MAGGGDLGGGGGGGGGGSHSYINLDQRKVVYFESQRATSLPSERKPLVCGKVEYNIYFG